MRILIVSWFFAPSNTIGAVRLGAIAGGLHQEGHDVRVLTATVDRYRQTFPLPIPPEQIYATRWFDVNAVPSGAVRYVKETLRGRGRWNRRAGGATDATASSDSKPATSGPRGGFGRIVRESLNNLYVNVFNWPDWQIGWLPYARRVGSKLVADWKPDVVFASGPPFTTLLIGYVISRRFKLPLVVEFRDRWSDDPYYPPPRWRRLIDQWGEQQIVRFARGLVTVSEPWAASYRQRYQKPTITIYNGYDDAHEESPGAIEAPFLKIRYLGGIYPGRRDPSVLFAAMKLMDTRKQDARIEFYGTNPDQVYPLAQSYGVRHRVEVFPEVTHAESIILQHTADALLLMQWNDPKEQGNIPGKFFEYLGARRPIIGMGYDQGVPAQLIKERSAGIYSNDPAELAQTLSAWLTIKQSQGRLPPLTNETCLGFSRAEQVERLEEFLRKVVETAEKGEEVEPGVHDIKGVAR